MAAAPLWRRVAAGLIDALALSICLVVLAAMVGTLLSVAEGLEATKLALAYWIPTLLMGLLPWLYFARFERGGKAYTFGKSTLGIQVVTADGGPLGFGRAALRYPLKLLLCWSLPLVALGRPTFYDQILGARVIRRA